ncbi:MAG: aminomethyl transferase family protein [Chloroflexi bacterium]|nr:aminomethyl transferase family protein [Chloroflexota bacterium]
MPIPTPFHSRQLPLVTSQEWREWSGYLAPITYGPSYEYEYYAIRNAAALIDVSPLFKYEISGSDATRLANRIFTRNIEELNIGQIGYTPWCDDHGKVIDDGTVWRLEENRYRVTAADPNLRWFQDVGYAMDVEVHDVSTQYAALALQGPQARNILMQLDQGAPLKSLPYYQLTYGETRRFPFTITRTGYTGDLGYELWVEAQHAECLWDQLMGIGQDYGLTPAGLAALDMARVEAGLLLIEVDYISANTALIDSQLSSPYELGLSWTVDLDGGEFIGKQALITEKRKGSDWTFVGLEFEWLELESIFKAVDLPPQVAGRANRDPIPIYKWGEQIGQVTSRVFSPIQKKYIGLGTVETGTAKLGEMVDVEVTVEYSRQRIRAKLVKPQFFSPKRKRAVLDD